MLYRAAASLVALLLFLDSCGSGSSDSNSTGSNGDASAGAVSTGFSGNLDFRLDIPGQALGTGADGQGGIAVGSAIGTVRNAKIVVYRLSDGEEIGRASTGDAGLVTLNLPTDFNDGVIVELSGTDTSDYYDVGVNEFRIFPVDFKLRSVQPKIDGNIGVGLHSESLVSALLQLRSDTDASRESTSGKLSTLPSARAAAELNLGASDVVAKEYDGLSRKLTSNKLHFNYPFYKTGNSKRNNDLSIFPGVFFRPMSTRPVPIPYKNFYLKSHEKIRHIGAEAFPLMAELYAEHDSSSSTPALSLLSRYRADFADDQAINLSQNADDTAYQWSLNTNLTFRTRKAFELLKLRFADEPDMTVDPYPLASFELAYPDEAGGFLRFQSLFTNFGDLQTSQRFEDGSTGVKFSLGMDVNQAWIGFPGLDLGVQFKGDARTVRSFGSDFNNYLDSEPTAEIMGVDAFDFMFDESISRYFRQNNHAGVTTSNFENSALIHVFGRTDTLLNGLSENDPVPVNQSISISLTNIFDVPVINPVGFWADPLGENFLALTRQGKLYNSLHPPQHLLDELVSDPLILPSLVASTAEMPVVFTPTELVTIDYTEGLLLQGCSGGTSAAGQPFLVATTAKALFGSLIIVDVLAVGDTLYWLTMDAGALPTYQLWSCGSSKDPNDPQAVEIATEPQLLLNSPEPLTLYPPTVGLPGVAFVGVTPGSSPLDGHSLYPLIAGYLLNPLNAGELGEPGVIPPEPPEPETIDASAFEYRSHTREIVTGPDGIEVEYVEYVLANDNTAEALIVHTRSDLDQDGGEGIFQIQHHKTASLTENIPSVADVYLILSSAVLFLPGVFDVLGDYSKQRKLDKADVLGDTADLDGVAVFSFQTQRVLSIRGRIQLK